MSVVVTDTGPLLHLHQAGAMQLLAHLGQVQVTPVVWSELQRHAPGFTTSGQPAWLSPCQLSASAALQAGQWVNAQVLHAGEAEALAHAREIQADMFLTDDTAAGRWENRLAFKFEARSAWFCMPPHRVISTRLPVCRSSTTWKNARRSGCQPR